MAIKIDDSLTPKTLLPNITRLFELSAGKILSLEKTFGPAESAPVFTAKGKYIPHGWTDWTQGFQFGSALLQFDATGEKRFLELGRARTMQSMASHVSNIGGHDHGFNNISTYGNLWRLMREGKIPYRENEQAFYELALKVSGAVQAARWTRIANGKGFIYSFNGPHSLFIDTIRSLRSLAVAHQLGHVLMGERGQRICLLQRLIEHAETTAQWNVYYSEGRDGYDERGRTAHESIFNANDGHYRCPNSQQGFSPFSTWTRGLAWAMLGFSEQLEFIEEAGALAPSIGEISTVKAPPTRSSLLPMISLLQKAAEATSEFYLKNTCADGVPMWDTGAPNLPRLGNFLDKSANPYNVWEPVDSSAAAIAAQGLLRLGKFLLGGPHHTKGAHYRQAGLTIASTLFSEPYLSTDTEHQGLLLHAVYHRPNGWDYIAPGQKVPNGESAMWGDYHVRELALLLLREAQGGNYLKFFDSSRSP